MEFGVAWGSKVLFYSKHGRVAYQIEGDGEQNGIQVKCSPYGKTCDLEVYLIGQLSLNFFGNVGCLRWHPIDYAITSTLIFLEFKIRRLLFDCSFSFSFTPIDRLWHDACSLASMERNAYIRACDSLGFNLNINAKGYNQIKKMRKA